MVRQTQTLLDRTGPCMMLASPSVPPRVSQCVLLCGLFVYPSSDPPCGGGPHGRGRSLRDLGSRRFLGQIRRLRPLFREPMYRTYD